MTVSVGMKEAGSQEQPFEALLQNAAQMLSCLQRGRGGADKGGQWGTSVAAVSCERNVKLIARL